MTNEYLHNVRRTLESALEETQRKDGAFTDVFIHCLDELKRAGITNEQTKARLASRDVH